MHILITEQVTFQNAYTSWLKQKGASPEYDLTMYEGALQSAATLVSELGSPKMPGITKASATIAKLQKEAKQLDALILKPHPGESLQSTSWFPQMHALVKGMQGENATLSFIASLALHPTSTYTAWPNEPTATP